MPGISANSQDHAWPCGSLLPNDLGLFDMLGNVFEWVQDQTRMRPIQTEGDINDIINIYECINEINPRLLRGGAFNYHPADVRSAYRDGHAPSNRSTNNGFRPSRTYH